MTDVRNKANDTRYFIIDIICKKCGSKNVFMVDYDEGMRLRCKECGTKENIS